MTSQQNYQTQYFYQTQLKSPSISGKKYSKFKSPNQSYQTFSSQQYKRELEKRLPFDNVQLQMLKKQHDKVLKSNFMTSQSTTAINSPKMSEYNYPINSQNKKFSQTQQNFNDPNKIKENQNNQYSASARVGAENSFQANNNNLRKSIWDKQQSLSQQQQSQQKTSFNIHQKKKSVFSMQNDSNIKNNQQQQQKSYKEVQIVQNKIKKRQNQDQAYNQSYISPVKAKKPSIVKLNNFNNTFFDNETPMQNQASKKKSVRIKSQLSDQQDFEIDENNTLNTNINLDSKNKSQSDLSTQKQSLDHENSNITSPNGQRTPNQFKFKQVKQNNSQFKLQKQGSAANNNNTSQNSQNTFSSQMHQKHEKFLRIEDELYREYKSTAENYQVEGDFQENTVAVIFQSIIDSVIILDNYKNTKYVQSVISKLTKFNKKLREFIYFDIDPSSYKQENFTMEMLLKKLIRQSVRQYQGQDKQIVKKFRPDRNLMDSLAELQQKLEELTLKHQQDTLKVISHSLIDTEKQVRDQIFNLEKIMIEGNRKHDFIQFKNHQAQTLQNKQRKVGQQLVQQLNKYEDKLGRFNHIKTLTRLNASNIDDLTIKLNYNYMNNYHKQPANQMNQVLSSNNLNNNKFQQNSLSHFDQK